MPTWRAATTSQPFREPSEETSGAMHTKTCAILLAMGGPDNTGNVREYLYNIFSDRTLIRLPGGPLLQKPFALMISNLRKKKVQQHYDLIGGGSPLLRWTQSQADQIAELLGDDLPDFRAYVGMRYFRPSIEQAVKQAYEDGCRRLVFLPMYPQYSLATTGSSFAVASKAVKRYPDLDTVFIKDFHNHPGYIELLRTYINDNIRGDETLLFSAHSLPQKFVDEGDPYVDQVYETARLAAGDREYVVAFQSRTGPVTWVGPDTVDETKRLLREREGGLFVVPIAFVCDHIETLYELDIELPQVVGGDAGKRLRRMPMFNDDSLFAEALADLIRERAGSRVGS
ncbi:ferrochelatase [candidate division GN15 bacterium]|nr:ferrochelatase [candidate division GN15 bacterium]